MKKIALLVMVCAILTSCTPTQVATSVVSYTFELVNVNNRGKDAKPTESRHYEDDIIGIGFDLNRSDIDIRIENKSNKPIKILWDEVVYVDTKNESLKVMHKGVKYVSANDAQMPTIIVPKSIYKDIIIPTNIIYASTTTGWGQVALFEAGEDGKTIRIYMPIVHNGVTDYYIFSFNLLEKKTKVNKAAKQSDDSVYK